MGIFLDQDAFVPALQEVSRSVMPFIEHLGIDAVQLPHAQGKITVRSFKKQVIVIIHEAIGVTDPVVAFIDAGQDGEKGFPVMIVFKNRLLFITAGSRVIYSAGVLNA